MASDASSDVTVQYLRSKPNQLNAGGGNALLRTSGHGVNGDDHDSDGNSVS
jgi:hypothetical protein